HLWSLARHRFIGAALCIVGMTVALASIPTSGVAQVTLPLTFNPQYVDPQIPKLVLSLGDVATFNTDTGTITVNSTQYPGAGITVTVGFGAASEIGFQEV